MPSARLEPSEKFHYVIYDVPAFFPSRAARCQRQAFGNSRKRTPQRREAREPRSELEAKMDPFDLSQAIELPLSIVDG